MFPRTPLLRGAQQMTRARISRFPPGLLTGSNSSASSAMGMDGGEPNSGEISGDGSPIASSSRLPGPYAITRTDGGGLPVYSKVRRGNEWKTIVRRIEGDAMSLRDDLAAHLRAIHLDPLRSPPGVTLSPTTKQLVVKGRWVEEVKEWLEERGF